MVGVKEKEDGQDIGVFIFLGLGQGWADDVRMGSRAGIISLNPDRSSHEIRESLTSNPITAIK